jgi:hypothetical protein
MLNMVYSCIQKGGDMPQNTQVPASARIKNLLWEWHTDHEKRVGHRVSVRQVAKDLDVDERTLAAWFKNTVTVYRADIMAKVVVYYGRDISQLFQLDETSEEKQEGQMEAVA